MKKLILILLLLGGCAYEPMNDPTSSTANNYYDNLQHCRFLIKEQTSSFDYGYNEVKYVSRCMIARGHTILNGE